MVPVDSPNSFRGDVGVPEPALSQCYKTHRIIERAKLKESHQYH